MNFPRAVISIDVELDRVKVSFGGPGLNEREFAAVARAAGRVCAAIGARSRLVRAPRNAHKKRKQRSPA
jgi:hypothetical protein